MNISLGSAELKSASERSKCAESLSLLRKVLSKHSTFLTLDTGHILACFT